MYRTQFTFYESFARAVQRIKRVSDRCAVYDSIVNYALYAQEPDLDNLPESVGIAFELVRPTLDSSRRKAESGKAGGKSKQNKAKQSKLQANPSKSKQTASKKEREDEKESEKEKEKEDECPLPLPPLTEGAREKLILAALGSHSGELLDAVRDWTRYKIEKHQPYKEMGYKSMLTQIEKHATEYGDQAMIEIIQQSMSSNYMGIVFDRLGKGSQKPADKLSSKYDMMRGWANG